MPPPELLSLPPGHRYRTGDLVAGKLRLVRPLGKGGMGVVWVAHNETLDVHVAVKVIELCHVAKPKLVGARVLQEARTAARLGHAAVCRVFDYGETEQGDPFVVTELLHGETLADLLTRERRMPSARAVGLLLPIVDGLVEAHSKGVVHRDVKPENIFLSHDNVQRLQPKLLDFGIARFVEADQKLTQDGTLLGTPHYMSPEQARGEPIVDARSDVWSLSVVLYELVTGALPFDGDNYNALLWAIGHDEPTSALDYGAGDAVLSAIIDRGLRKHPGERWGTVRELGEQLAAWLHSQGLREDICGVSLRATWLEGTPLDPGPDPTFTDIDPSTLRPHQGTGELRLSTRRASQNASSLKTYTGVLTRAVPVLSYARKMRRWGIGIAAAALLAGLTALGFAHRRTVLREPAISSSEVDVRQPSQVIRTDFAMPVLTTSEVSSAPPRPSAETPSLLPRRRAPLVSRPRKASMRIDPERYDLGF